VSRFGRGSRSAFGQTLSGSSRRADRGKRSKLKKPPGPKKQGFFRETTISMGMSRQIPDPITAGRKEESHATIDNSKNDREFVQKDAALFEL
jgi:hypothetical protein